jgi:hypothetical protein
LSPLGAKRERAQMTGLVEILRQSPAKFSLFDQRDGQKKALRIADNRLAELAGWDEDLLALEFSSLVDMDSDSDLNFELEITGFSFGAIDQLIDVAKKDNSSDSDDCFESEFTVPTVSQLGDLWLLEEHTIVCGDARDGKVHARARHGLLAQVAICDPPYNVKSEGHISGLGKIVHDDFVMAVEVRGHRRTHRLCAVGRYSFRSLK